MAKEKKISQNDYDKHFKTKPHTAENSSDSYDTINKEALKQALDTRKFEIELYWKRATYFWVFIAATFAAYGAVADSSLENNTDLLVIISCIGIVFSFAWICVIRGSKQWQENWENHVYLLEDKIIGPLFKTTLMRPELNEWFLSPKPFSVSKINLLVSYFIFIVWVGLLLLALSKFSFIADFIESNISTFLLVIKYIIILSVTIGTCILIYCKGKSDSYKSSKIKNKNDYETNNAHFPIASEINIKIVDPKDIEETKNK